MPTRVPYPSPILDENCAPMGPDILSGIGGGVFRLCLIGGLLTSGFRNGMTRDVGASVSTRHPNVATYSLAKHCVLWGNRQKERSHLDGERSLGPS